MARSQPYDFETFDDPAAAGVVDAVENQYDGPTGPELFTQEQMDAAIAAAREAGEASASADAMRRQTEQLTKIADALTATAAAERTIIDDHIDALMQTARSTVETFCLTAAARQVGDAAMAMLEPCLRASADDSQLMVILPAQTDAGVHDAIRDRLAARADNHNVDLETCEDLAAGEVRIAWRGGAMMRQHSDLKTQIAQLFDAAANDAKGNAR